MSFSIDLRQTGLFKKRLRMEDILLEGMRYGTMAGRTALKENAVSNHGFIMFHPGHISRGITVLYKEGEKVGVEMSLSLPTSQEEIDDFFASAAKIRRRWNCEMMVNGRDLKPEYLESLREEVSVFNLKRLHQVMLEILNRDGLHVDFACAKHRLVAGKLEAEKMYAGTDTAVFRDWMHRLQNMDVYYPDPAFRKLEDGKVKAVVSLPAGRQYLLRVKPSIPMMYYDMETGKPGFSVNKWKIALCDGEEPFMEISYQRFLKEYAKERGTYYDASSIILPAFDRSEILAFFQE